MSLLCSYSRKPEESAQTKSAHKKYKILGARDVTIRAIRFLEGRAGPARELCPLLILMGEKSKKVRTSMEIFLLEWTEADARPPLYILMGKKRPKHFKEKSFIQATTGGGHADEPPSIPSLVRRRFTIEKDPHFAP